jgi:hypothetical protein
LARTTSIVDGSAYMVPDGRLDLPFIDQARGWSIQNKGWIDPNRLTSCFIGVESNFTFCELPSGRGLSACLWPFEDDCPEAFDSVDKVFIDDPWPIVHFLRFFRGFWSKGINLRVI